jgi:hypothetical protein
MMDYDKLFDSKFTYILKPNESEKLIAYFNKKKGWVYIAFYKDNQLLKIGRTGKNPLERARSLSTVGVLNDYEILFSLPVFNQFIVESKVHHKLKKYRVTKEFFSVNKDVAIHALQKEYENERTILNRYVDVEMIDEDLNLLEYAIKKT